MKYELGKKSEKIDRRLSKLTNKREKIKRQKAERRRYFVSGCTQTKTKSSFLSLVFKKKKKKDIFFSFSFLSSNFSNKGHSHEDYLL